MYSPRLTLAIFIATSLAIGWPIVSANAQTLPPGMQQISGKYTDASTGLQITFPDGWTGFQAASAGSTFAMTSPGGASMSGGTTNPIMFVTIGDKKPVNASNLQPPSPSGQSSQQTNCTPSTAQKTTVNGMSAYAASVDCTGTSPFKAKGYIFQTATKNILVMYGSSSAANFDKDVAQFDSSVTTLQIPNTVDVTVVPEFPIAGVVSIAAVVGVIAILGRTKIFSSLGLS